MKENWKTGQLSRIDLLEALLDGDDGQIKSIADRLDLEPSDRMPLSSESPDANTPSIRLAFSRKEELKQGNQAQKGIEQQFKTPIPSFGYWSLKKREPTELEAPTIETNTDTDISTDVGWINRPTQAPYFQAISSPKALLSRLFHHLKHHRYSHEIDADKVAETISKGEYLQTIPKRTKRSLGRHLHIIDDRHVHLVPYWRDHDLFSRLLASFLPDYDCSFSVWQDGMTEPVSINNGRFEPWQLPPANSVVLAISDLGQLSTIAERLMDKWIDIAQRLHRQDCKLIALIPFHPEDCDSSLKKYVTLESWEPAKHIQKYNSQIHLQHVDYLLDCLSPAVRLEPEILRSVRKMLSLHGKHMDAVVESLVWQHAYIQDDSSIAASLDSEQRKHRLSRFARLDENIKSKILHIIRNRRIYLNDQIWFEEMISLDQASQHLLPKEDWLSAKQYFQALNRRYQQDDRDKDTETECWYRRMETRLPDDVWNAEVGDSLQNISAKLHEHDEIYQANYPIDPAKLPDSNKPEQTAYLYQHKEQIVLRHHQATDKVPNGYSLLASIRFKRGHLYTRLNAKQASLSFREENQQPKTVVKLSRQASYLLIRSDVETLHIRYKQRAHWMERIGRDQYGLFADVMIKTIPQRFRFIPPGQFQMGSPASEDGRWDDEDLHSVTLTEGFWLAETTCTQALWQAVMGKNSSRFKGEQHPVEQVSWDDVQAFIDKLNQQQPDLNASLPTEAEWEYACRAGTQTPFNFVGELSISKVNFSGKWNESGYIDEAKQQTVAVKSMNWPNAWGLHEMHGNVWEWCQDAWQGNLGTRPVQNPKRVETGAHRVIRGGSWQNYGRSVRSACRDYWSPDYRDDDVGFRLRLGL